jgi:hypothetical protein
LFFNCSFMRRPLSEVITERGRKKYATTKLKIIYFIDRSPDSDRK